MASFFRYESGIVKFLNDLEATENKNIKDAAGVVKRAIKKKANRMKITGNLAEGVYMHSRQGATHVGIRAPGYHNWLIEFGHLGRDGKKVPAYPIVYPSFEEKSMEVENLLSRPIRNV